MYITDYHDGVRTIHGPFKRIEVRSINVSIPPVTPTSISFYVEHTNGETETIVISMNHTIDTRPAKDET